MKLKIKPITLFVLMTVLIYGNTNASTKDKFIPIKAGQVKVGSEINFC